MFDRVLNMSLDKFKLMSNDSSNDTLSAFMDISSKYISLTNDWNVFKTNKQTNKQWQSLEIWKSGTAANLYISLWLGNIFKYMLANAFASLKIYSTQLHISTLAKFSPRFLSSSPGQSEIIHSLTASSSKNYSPQQKGGEKLWGCKLALF